MARAPMQRSCTQIVRRKDVKQGLDIHAGVETNMGMGCTHWEMSIEGQIQMPGVVAGRKNHGGLESVSGPIEVGLSEGGGVVSVPPDND